MSKETDALTLKLEQVEAILRHKYGHNDIFVMVEDTSPKFINASVLFSRGVTRYVCAEQFQYRTKVIVTFDREFLEENDKSSLPYVFLAALDGAVDSLYFVDGVRDDILALSTIIASLKSFIHSLKMGLKDAMLISTMHYVNTELMKIERMFEKLTKKAFRLETNENDR